MIIPKATPLFWLPRTLKGLLFWNGWEIRIKATPLPYYMAIMIGHFRNAEGFKKWGSQCNPQITRKSIHVKEMKPQYSILQ